MIYRIPDEHSVSKFSVDVLSQEPHQAKADFDIRLKTQYELAEVPDDEFSRLAGHSHERE